MKFFKTIILLVISALFFTNFSQAEKDNSMRDVKTSQFSNHYSLTSVQSFKNPKPEFVADFLNGTFSKKLGNIKLSEKSIKPLVTIWIDKKENYVTVDRGLPTIMKLSGLNKIMFQVIYSFDFEEPMEVRSVKFINNNGATIEITAIGIIKVSN